MRTGRIGLVTALALVCSAGAAEPRGVVIQVEAGAHERRDTPLLLRLPDGITDAEVLALERLDDGHAVTVQKAMEPGPTAGWVLERPLAPGASRRYLLHPVTRPTRDQLRDQTGQYPRKPQEGTEQKEDDQGLTVRIDGRTVLRYHSAVVEPPRGIERVYRRSGFIHPLATRTGRGRDGRLPPRSPAPARPVLRVGQHHVRRPPRRFLEPERADRLGRARQGPGLQRREGVLVVRRRAPPRRSLGVGRQAGADPGRDVERSRVQRTRLRAARLRVRPDVRRLETLDDQQVPLRRVRPPGQRTVVRPDGAGRRPARPGPEPGGASSSRARGSTAPTATIPARAGWTCRARSTGACAA